MQWRWRNKIVAKQVRYGRRGARGQSAVKFTIEGFDELVANLQDLPKATQRNTIKKSLLVAAKPFVDHAKRIVPVNTGALKDSIVAGGKIDGAGKSEYSDALASGGTKAEAVAALRAARREKGRMVEIYAGVIRLAWYAHFVEFGTEKTEARPFIRPAWDAEKENMLRVLQEELGTQVMKAIQRRAKKLARLAAKGK